ncbi:DUF4825 domain-containing protein [Bacillus coreaensis]
MRKTFEYLLLSLMLILFITGCKPDAKNASEDIFQFKDSFVGDNSAVGNIVNQLPGAEHLKHYELKTDVEPYGITLNYNGLNSEQEYQETVIYNATFLIALVQNVDWITVHSDKREFTITKENIQEWYSKELRDVPNELELIKLINKCLVDISRNNVISCFSSLLKVQK